MLPLWYTYPLGNMPVPVYRPPITAGILEYLEDDEDIICAAYYDYFWIGRAYVK